MAGHSQFKNIMHRKGAQDAKRAKVFTKIIRELTVAAGLGSDPEANSRLRSAMSAARNANMPKDTMERAIKRGAGGEDDTNYEEVRYEGYGPAGTAIIVEALTDNRNRTAAEVRAAFAKYGGNLGESNSVTFMFDRIGMIQYPAAIASEEAMFEAALEVGATNVDSDPETHEIHCAPEDLNTVREGLNQKYGEPQVVRLAWQPRNFIRVDGDHAETLFKLVDVLEDNDDVQLVSGNYQISDEMIQKLSS
ncbi:MAG: YebC/PmpR family DNA-binding transcriptional regulator [Alphaproteobacteria bacterium]|nr:YebC/PmpR family DNA-binding transcriptional regulator [Alphaproteobacteria bacterium]